MKRLAACLLMFACSLAGRAAPGEPAAPPATKAVVLEAQIWRVPHEGSRLAHAQICDGAQWDALCRADHAELLEDLVVNSLTGIESQVHLGNKRPFTYVDPRAQRAQVNYVDVGCKVDVRADPSGDGGYDIKVLPELSSYASNDPGNLEPTDVLKASTAVMLRPGEVAVVGATRGAWTSRVLGANYPQEHLGSNDTVLIVIRLVSAER